MKSIYALIAELALAGIASAHGVPVLRSQACYAAPVQVQAVYAAPVVQAVYAAPVAVHACEVRAAVIAAPYPVTVQQVQANVYNVAPVYQQAVVQQVQVRQQVLRVRQPQVFQRSVTRTRTIVR